MEDRQQLPVAEDEGGSSPIAARDERPYALRAPPLRWKVPLALLLLTIASTMFAGWGWAGSPDDRPLAGWTFAVPLMLILLAHEFGHYTFARLRGVPVSLPYFIPLPLISPLGTLGAVIRMERARSRNALLDVGASGPIAGLCVAVPVLAIGLWLSHVAPDAAPTAHVTVEGQSLLYVAMKRLVVGPIPDGSDVWLHPTAMAGWVGLLVTMINLLPVGQLDGGHVAYALFGKRQDFYANVVHALLPGIGVAVSSWFATRAWLAGWRGDALVSESVAGVPWLFWGGFLLLLRRLSGGDHPPVDESDLSPRRRLVAIGTLAIFVLLFMPAWLRSR